MSYSAEFTKLLETPPCPEILPFHYLIYLDELLIMADGRAKLQINVQQCPVVG